MRVATVDSAATAICPAVVDPTGMLRASAMAVGLLSSYVRFRWLLVGGPV